MPITRSARWPPPNSRAISPPTTTVAPAASAGHTRSPGSDTPNSLSDTHKQGPSTLINVLPMPAPNSPNQAISTAKTIPPIQITR